MKLVLAMVTILVGCGSPSGSNSTTPKSGPVYPPGYTGFTQTIQALRDATTNTPGTWTASQTTIVTIPLPTDLVLNSNASEFYHAGLTIGPVSCDYIHQAGAGEYTNGSGCTTTDNQVTLSPGQTVSLNINNAVTQNTVTYINLNMAK